MPMGGVAEGTHPHAIKPNGSTHGHFFLFQVSLAPKDQNGEPSNSTIDILDLTKKQRTVNSLRYRY